MQWGEWYVRPALDLDGYHVRTGGFAETGAGAFNMVMQDNEETFGAATLSLTGGVTARWAGALWHPYVEANVTGNSADSFDLTGRLQGAPSSVSDFTLSSALPGTLVGGKLGLEAFFPYGSLRAELEQRQGDDGYETYAGSLKVRFGF
jgi:outer membrane autotransporter protein